MKQNISAALYWHIKKKSYLYAQETKHLLRQAQTNVICNMLSGLL